MTKSSCQPASEIVIFGALGDLSRRKLLLALYQLDVCNSLHGQSRIVGVARQEYSLDEFKTIVLENIRELIKETNEEFDEDALARFSARLVYQQLDMENAVAYKHLARTLAQANNSRIYYFSTPPAIYGDICDGLNHASLITSADRVVMEKPIGHCLASSKVINDQVARFFTENQIYRIDHYLGKETVLNLLVLRFANALFTTNWDRNSIDHVQITVAESVGIENRGNFYDETGQMRDMIQSHLLQILSLLAMEPPANLSAENIRAEKLKVVKALAKIDLANVKDKVVLGQYTSGFINGIEVPNYVNEDNVNTNSKTETFVAVKAEINNWRWSGVPFYLRTGKRMAIKHSEIVVHFKAQPHNIFKRSYSDLPANKLTIRLQPDEGIELQMMNKIPGIEPQIYIQKSKLDLSLSDTYQNGRIIDAYERLILEVLNGNQSLFVSRDEVEAAWAWTDSIIDAWAFTQEYPKLYTAGSWGPESSINLIARDNRKWEK